MTSRDVEKTASEKSGASPGTRREGAPLPTPPVAWRDVLRAVGDDDDARRSLVVALGLASASPDAFDSRGPRRRLARAAIVGVLTTLEDRAELAGARAQRAALRVLRRALEGEVTA
jgi:hypothetical protein